MNWHWALNEKEPCVPHPCCGSCGRLSHKACLVRHTTLVPSMLLCNPVVQVKVRACRHAGTSSRLLLSAPGSKYTCLPRRSQSIFAASSAAGNKTIAQLASSTDDVDKLGQNDQKRATMLKASPLALIRTPHLPSLQGFQGIGFAIPRAAWVRLHGISTRASE